MVPPQDDTAARSLLLSMYEEIKAKDPKNLLICSKDNKIVVEEKNGILNIARRAISAIFHPFSYKKPYDLSANLTVLQALFKEAEVQAKGADTSKLKKLAKKLEAVVNHATRPNSNKANLAGVLKRTAQNLHQTLGPARQKNAPVWDVGKIKAKDDAQKHFVETSPIYKHLGGTSDHRWKTYAFSVEEPGLSQPAVSVKCGTWNLMDCCYKTSRMFYNNPINHNESAEDYLARKRVQIQELKQLISGASGVADLDLMVLQEVDFFTQKDNQRAPAHFQKAYQLVYREFREMLTECGWEMLTTDPRIPKDQQDPLITIYNPKKVKPEAGTEHLEGCFQQQRQGGNVQMRGAQGIFVDQKTKNRVVIANLHLDYSVEPQQQIEEYQNANMKKGLATIALGDLNRPPNKALYSAIADWNYVTNPDATDRSNPATLTLQDQDPAKASGFNKTYDAALASPTATGKIVVRESEMTFFMKKEDGGLEVRHIDVAHQHESLVGRPWKRRRMLKHDIERELQVAKKQKDPRRIAKLTQELALFKK